MRKELLELESFLGHIVPKILASDCSIALKTSVLKFMAVVSGYELTEKPKRADTNGDIVQSPNTNITLGRAEPPAIAITLTQAPPEPSENTKRLEAQYQASKYAENVVGLMNGHISRTVVVENGKPIITPNEDCVVRLDKTANKAYVAEWVLEDMWAAEFAETKQDTNIHHLKIKDLLCSHRYCLGSEKVSMLAGTPFENGKIMCWKFDLTKL